MVLLGSLIYAVFGVGVLAYFLARGPACQLGEEEGIRAGWAGLGAVLLGLGGLEMARGTALAGVGGVVKGLLCLGGACLGLAGAALLLRFPRPQRRVRNKPIWLVFWLGALAGYLNQALLPTPKFFYRPDQGCLLQLLPHLLNSYLLLMSGLELRWFLLGKMQRSAQDPIAS
jgi:hypothetical protein